MLFFLKKIKKNIPKNFQFFIIAKISLRRSLYEISNLVKTTHSKVHLICKTYSERENFKRELVMEEENPWIVRILKNCQNGWNIPELFSQ